MGYKNFIAAFFILVFLGKMISLDAKFLMVLFDSSEVTLVNNLCPKQQLPNDSPDEFAQVDLEFHFEYDYLCQVAFDLKPGEDIKTVSLNNFKKHNYRAPGNFSISPDKFYPPPKV